MYNVTTKNKKRKFYTIRNVKIVYLVLINYLNKNLKLSL